MISSQGSVTPIINRLELSLRSALATGHVFLTLSRESLQNTRTPSQNALMWPLLTDVSRQVEHLDGKKHSPDDWKDILTAAFEGCNRYAPNLDGTGLIAFGSRTSKYNKKKMSEFIEFIYAEGTLRGVIWSDKSNATIEEVRAQ